MNNIYAIRKYIYDTESESYTRSFGEVVAVIEAEHYFDAMEKSGFNDPDKYGAEQVFDLRAVKKAITEERTNLDKIEKQVDAFIAVQDEIRSKCPNCDGKLNDRMRCDSCGYGKDGDIIIGGMIDNVIKDFTKRVSKGTMTQEKMDKEIEDMKKILGGNNGMTPEEVDQALKSAQQVAPKVKKALKSAGVSKKKK